VSAPAVLLPRPPHPAGAERSSASTGLSLAALLDLFDRNADQHADPRPAQGGDRTAAAGTPTAGTVPVGLAARLRDWSRRAAAWGAGPAGCWRAW
jgi:hypothetical protein